MKVILDTNVFVSGVFFSGPPYTILKAWRDGKVQLATSPDILQEYTRVGEELSKKFPAINIGPFLELVAMNAEMVSPAESAGSICDDPDDDKFFLCAISARCRIIVSGDKHLLAMSSYGRVRVLTPRDFVQRFL